MTELVAVFILPTILLGLSMAGPVPGSHDMFYAESSGGQNKAGMSRSRSENGGHDLFFANAGMNHEDGINYGVGFLSHDAKVQKDGFGVSHKIGVLGAEMNAGNSKLGSMARVTAIDGTLHTGPVDLNYGIGIDTGAKWDRGPEVKLLGNGGKITDEEVEGCVFGFCFGIKWG